MKLPNSEHTSRPWRIHDIATDFKLLDVWALPVDGAREEFDDLIELVSFWNPANLESVPARLVWAIRDRIGSWLGLSRISAAVDAAGPGRGPRVAAANDTDLAERLPADLRNSARGVRFVALPFVPLYRTDVEFVAELSNKTVHGLMHLGWVERSDEMFEGQMAVYVQPRGRFGAYYLRAIEPFRQAIVYPALMRQIARAWRTRNSPD